MSITDNHDRYKSDHLASANKATNSYDHDREQLDIELNFVSSFDDTNVPEPPPFDDNFHAEPPLYTSSEPYFDDSYQEPRPHFSPPNGPSTPLQGPLAPPTTQATSPALTSLDLASLLAATSVDMSNEWPQLDISEPLPTMRAVIHPNSLGSLRQRRRSHTLEADEFMSHIMSADELFAMKSQHSGQGAILEGGCGTGKTRMAISFDSCFVFCAPTQFLVQQTAARDSSMQMIIGGVEPDFDKYKRFACTYDSYPRLVRAAIEKALNPYMVPVYVDECHHPSSDSFKPHQLNAFMSELRRCQSVVMMSATVTPFIPYFEDLTLINVTKKNAPTIKWGYSIGSTTARITKSLEDGLIVMAHLDNKSLAETYKLAYENKGYRVIVISSKTKDEIMASGLSDEELPDADLYINTSVFNDGLSVHNISKPYVNVISQESTRNNGQFETVQYGHRLRNNPPRFVYIMRSNEEFEEDLIFTERTYRFVYGEMMKEAHELATLYNQQEAKRRTYMATASPSETAALNAMVDRLKKTYRSDALVNWNGDTKSYEPNMLFISQEVYKLMKSSANRSRHVMEHWLLRFNFRYEGITYVEDSTDIDADVIKLGARLSDQQRKRMREHIDAFDPSSDDDWEEVKRLTKEIATNAYSQADDRVPEIERFTEEIKAENPDMSADLIQIAATAARRAAIRDVVRDDDLKRKAATHYKDIVDNLTANGMNFLVAKREARKALLESTLKSNAITRLKSRSELALITQNALDDTSSHQFEMRLAREVVQVVVIGEPLDKQAVNEVFNRLVQDQPRLGAAFVREPKQKNPTPEQVIKAEKAQWKKRRNFIGDLFEFKRATKRIDGKRKTVRIPTGYRFNAERS